MSRDEQAPLGPAWRVTRRSGLLWPGFTKRFSDDGSAGMTALFGRPIGAFDLHEASDGSGCVELRYRRWPIVDVVDGDPVQQRGPIDAIGCIRLPGGRRARFCGFRLERV